MKKNRDYSVLLNFNILYLEDDVFLLKYTKDVLDDYLKNVFAVKTISEAMNIFKNKKIDLIISDILLKNENGLEFIKKIKEDRNIKIPIILTTAHTNTNYLLDSIKLKVDNYLIKPIEFNILIESIYNLLLPVMQNKQIEKNNSIIKIISLVTDSKQVEVIKYIMNNLNENDELIASYADIMNEIEISKPTLIKLFKKILDKNILKKISHKTYKFNQNELDQLI